MDTNSIQQITELYNRYFSSAIAIRDIFINHFGEENVDSTIPTEEIVSILFTTRPVSMDTLNNIYSSFSITVKFPEVTITNEQGNSVQAKNIYALIPLSIRYDRNRDDSFVIMTNAFTLSRSHYPESHILSDYMHSHCNGLPFVDGRDAFLSCCLGSGPIRRTISTLCAEYNLHVWQLFCFELEAFVQTESLAGGPWRRMSNISSTPYTYRDIDNRFTVQNSLGATDALYETFKDFITYFIRNNKLPFNYIDGCYGIAMSYLDFALLVSNEFIKWMNREDNPYRNELVMGDLKAHKVLDRYIIIDNRIHIVSGHGNNSVATIEYLKDKFLFSFKGQPVKIEIVSDLEETCTTTNLLSNTAIGYIATLITKSVNYFYGNKHFEAANSDVAADCKYRFL